MLDPGGIDIESQTEGPTGQPTIASTVRITSSPGPRAHRLLLHLRRAREPDRVVLDPGEIAIATRGKEQVEPDGGLRRHELFRRVGRRSFRWYVGIRHLRCARDPGRSGSGSPGDPALDRGAKNASAGALRRPARARATAGQRAGSHQACALLGRAHPQDEVGPPRPRRRAEPARRCQAAPRLSGQARGRPMRYALVVVLMCTLAALALAGNGAAARPGHGGP